MSAKFEKKKLLIKERNLILERALTYISIVLLLLITNPEDTLAESAIEAVNTSAKALI